MTSFYFIGSERTAPDGSHSWVELSTTPTKDIAPLSQGTRYVLALPKAVTDALPEPLVPHQCYKCSADEWWLDKREGKPANLLHGKNLIVEAYNATRGEN